MAIYGQSLYSKDYYGIGVVVQYSVGQVQAIQTGYGEITVYWTTPMNTENWSTLRLVRNTAGYPSSEEDGYIVVEFDSTTPQNSFTDSGLTGGKFYYYTVFLASSFPAYSSTTTYQVGDTVSYGGSNWLCTTANTLNVTPSVSASQWQATNATSLWNRAGQAASLAVADNGYRDTLYNLLPSPYSSGQQEITTPQSNPTDQLYRYLSVLAFALDMTRTELGEQQHLHRTETMPLSRMELLAAQIGVPPEASITPRLRRYRVQNASQLAKRKGSLESIKEAIYTTTGYNATITPSINRMLDADQAEFWHPLYSAWDPSVTYQPGAVVSYQGYLYAAASNTTKLSSATLTVAIGGGTPAYTIQSNQPTATYYNNQQVLFNSNAQNDYGTITFSIPATGTYDISVGLTKSYDYANIGIQVDSTTATANGTAIVFDAYAPSPAPSTSVYLGNFSLTSGNHTLKLTAVSKDPKSGTVSYGTNGYQMGCDFITFTPTGSGAGTGSPPSGTTANNSFWTYTTALLATTVLANPLTGGISSWEQVSFTTGANASNSSLAVYSGYAPLDAVGDNTHNLAVMTNGTGVNLADLAVHSIPRALVSTWNSATTYARGSYVSYKGSNYLALLPNLNNEPDVDPVHWKAETISTTGPDPFLVASYGIPLVHTQVWTAGASYNAGDVVQFEGQRYIAAVANQGQSPTGRPTDNISWSWVSSAQDAYTASAYVDRYSGTGTGNVTTYIEWYDASGNLITTINPTGSTAGGDLLVSFSRNSANLITDPGSSSSLNGGTWTNSSSIDTPVASSGMAYWATRNDSNGRAMVTNYNQATVNVGITFMTAPPSGIEHGIVFRWSSSTNFWSVSRTRLSKVVSGTLTTIASWSSLPNGARIYASLNGSIITVYQYQGPGLAPIQLATVTDAFNSGATQYGIFERHY